MISVNVPTFPDFFLPACLIPSDTSADNFYGGPLG